MKAKFRNAEAKTNLLSRLRDTYRLGRCVKTNDQIYHRNGYWYYLKTGRMCYHSQQEK